MANSTIDYPEQTDFEATLDLWKRHLSDKAASTIDCYLGDVRRVAEALQSRLGRMPSCQEIMDLGPPDLDRVVDHWAADAPVTIRRRLVSLRQYCKAVATMTGRVGPLLYARFPVVEVPVVASHGSFDLDELMVHQPSDVPWVGARDDAIAGLVAGHGITTGELSMMDGMHVSGSMVMVDRSRWPLRLVEIDEDLAAMIARYAGLCPCPIGAHGALWVNQRGSRLSTRSVQMMLRARRAAAGLPPYVVAGSFKRRRIQDMAEGGMQPRTIASMMGIGVETVLHHLRPA